MKARLNNIWQGSMLNKHGLKPPIMEKVAIRDFAIKKREISK
jgi:hypothetical protein